VLRFYWTRDKITVSIKFVDGKRLPEVICNFHLPQ